MTVVVAPPMPNVCMKFNVNINNNNGAVPATATQAVVSYDNQLPQTQTLTNGSTSGPPATFTAVGSGIQAISVVYLNSASQPVGSETGMVVVTGGPAGSISTVLTTVAGVTSAVTTLSCSDGITQLNGTVQYSANGSIIGTATVTNGVVANPTILGTLPAGTVVTVTFVQTGTACAICSFAPTEVVVGGGNLCSVVLEPVQGPVFVGVPTTVSASVTCNGLPISGASVTFTSGATSVTVTTNAAGVASTPFTFTTAGTVTLTASASATSDCSCTNVAATPINVVVVPSPSCLVQLLVPSTVIAGQPTSVTALITCNGTPVAGATVQFTGGTSAVTATTGNNGVANASVTFGSAGMATLTATVTMAPTTQCSCAGSNTSVTVTVSPQASCCVVLLPVEDEVVVGEPTTLSAVVLCNCAPVVGATVTFTGGPIPVTAITDNTGVASAQVIFTTAGTATVTATVTEPGGATCPCTNVASTPIVIIVEKEKKPKLKAFPACWEINLPIPFPHPFTAKLRAAISPPVAGQRIDFYVGDDFVGFALTDATGNATLQAGLSPFQIISPFYKAVANVGSTRLEATSLLLPCIPPV